MKRIHTIYDRASKRCISISKPTTIMLINGLYNTHYSLDSQVTYNWTEHHDDDLRKTLSDTIITINGTHSYHIEFQMYEEGNIIMRVFDYGYRHAITDQTASDILEFPEPVIVYLYEEDNVPQYHLLHIRFGTQGQFIYQVPTIRYLKLDKEELERRKLIVLIPFQLLRLRKTIEKKRTPQNLEALKTLIQCDILESIEKNVAAGNITASDARILKNITWQLYRHIYQKYDELEKAGVNQLIEDAMILEVDILEKKFRDAEKKLKDIEIKCKDAETKFKNAETKRKDAETKFKNAETKRKDAEAKRNDAETRRKDAETKCAKNEKVIMAKDNAIKELSAKLRHLGISDEEILQMITPDSGL